MTLPVHVRTVIPINRLDLPANVSTAPRMCRLGGCLWWRCSHDRRMPIRERERERGREREKDTDRQRQRDRQAEISLVVRAVYNKHVSFSTSSPHPNQELF